MSCIIPLLEDQIELLRKQVKDAALSHDVQFAKITALEAENATLREQLNPTPPMMTASAEFAGGDSGENQQRQTEHE